MGFQFEIIMNALVSSWIPMNIMLDLMGLEETSYIYVDNKMITKACTHKMILFTRICTQTNILYITPDLINQEHNRQSAAMICKKLTTFFINKWNQS